MSTIDLERLIVRQTYFIPIQSSELKRMILNELNSPHLKIDELYPWRLMEEHKLSFHFEYSLKYAFIYDATWSKNVESSEFKEMVKEKSKEFDDLGTKAFYTELKDILPNLPMDVYVSIKKIEKDGCLFKVECSPTLYKKLRFLKKKKTNDLEMQDAYLTCRRFLENIFESGLSATLISEEKKKLLKPASQLLINDEASRQILSKIEEMLKHATGEVLLCGWIGTLLLPKLKEIKQKGVNIRVITHKKTELKGQPGRQDIQRAFGELISMISEDNISVRPECHCRVVVVDNKALIGSMDLNATSLTGSHRELAIYTEDLEIVRNLRKYFNGIFSPLSKEKAK